MRPWAVIAAAAAVMMSAPASAASYVFDFSGGGLSGTVSLTYEANPNTGPIGTSPMLCVQVELGMKPWRF